MSVCWKRPVNIRASKSKRRFTEPAVGGKKFRICASLQPQSERPFCLPIRRILIRGPKTCAIASWRETFDDAVRARKQTARLNLMTYAGAVQLRYFNFPHQSKLTTERNQSLGPSKAQASGLRSLSVIPSTSLSKSGDTFQDAWHIALRDPAFVRLFYPSGPMAAQKTWNAVGIHAHTGQTQVMIHDLL